MRAASPAGGKGRIPGKAAEPRPRALGLRRRPGKSQGRGGQRGLVPVQRALGSLAELHRVVVPYLITITLIKLGESHFACFFIVHLPAVKPLSSLIRQSLCLSCGPLCKAMCLCVPSFGRLLSAEKHRRAWSTDQADKSH